MKKILLLIISSILAISVTGCTLFSQSTDVTDTSLDEQETLNPALDPSYFSDCPTACEHYVDSCLSLNLDATEESLEEGEEFCIEDCQKWDVNKVNCVANAIDCEAMADYCGL